MPERRGSRTPQCPGSRGLASHVQLCDDNRIAEAFASFGDFFILPPADTTGRGDLDRLQLAAAHQRRQKSAVNFVE